jgi:dienelactone hydrolase
MKRRGPIYVLIAITLFVVALGCGDDDDDSLDDDDAGPADDDDDTAIDDDDDDDNNDDTTVPAYDPSQPGPYPVGSTTLILIDDSRNDPATNGPRTLVTEIWYPAAEEAWEMDPDRLGNFFAPWEQEVLAILADRGAPPEEIANFDMEVGSVRDAPIRQDAGPFPMIVFSHGNAGVRFQNFVMCEYLASHGFVVIAPDHTGNAMVAPLPNGPIEFDENLVFPAYWYRKADLGFLITTFTDLNEEDPDDFFTGRLDPLSVGAIGHSFGGTAAVETTRRDHRISATLVMASFMFPWRPEEFDASLMFFIGQQDDTMGDATFLFRYDYQIAIPPKFKLECKDGGHYTFTDACLMVPSIIGNEDGCGQGERKWTGEPFDFIEHDAAWAVQNPYITAFFGFNLRGEKHMATYLTEDHTTEPYTWMWRME